MIVVAGVDNKVGLAALKGMGGIVPLFQQELAGDVEFVEDRL